MPNLGAQRYSEQELVNAGFKQVGKNVQISKRASIYGTENITLGDNIRIDDFATLIATNELNIGNYVSIHNYCFIGAKYGVTLEDFVTLAPGSKIFSASDDYSGEYMTGVMLPAQFTGGAHGKVTLGKHTILGANAIVLPNTHLSEGTSLGANSLVKEDTLPWHIYHGTPAKIYKARAKRALLLEEKI